MGAGASTITVAEADPSIEKFSKLSPRSVAQVEKLDLKYDLTLIKEHKSGRSLGAGYRMSNLVSESPQATLAGGEDQWARLYKVSRTANKFKKKQQKLMAHSVGREVDERMRREKEAKEWAEQEKAKAVKAETRLLSRAWHRVSETRKYYTKARSIVSVSVFLNHDGEFVVAATQPTHNDVIHPIHFAAEDFLPSPSSSSEDKSLDKSLDELRLPPKLETNAKELLTRGNRLTITRSPSADEDDEDRLVLSLIDVPHAPAEDVVSPRVLNDIKRQTLEHWAPNPTREHLLETELVRRDIASGISDDQKAINTNLTAFDSAHGAVVASAARLHAMHEVDAKVLASLDPPSSPKKRRRHAPTRHVPKHAPVHHEPRNVTV